MLSDVLLSVSSVLATSGRCKVLGGMKLQYGVHRGTRQSIALLRLSPYDVDDGLRPGYYLYIDLVSQTEMLAVIILPTYVKTYRR